MREEKIRGMLKTVLIIAVFVFIIYVFIQSSWFQRKIYPIRYGEYVLKYAVEYQVDPCLILAVIWVESKFNRFSTSRKGARGLMQITPETGRWIAKKIGIDGYSDAMLYDAEANIQMGCWYISELLRQFKGNISLVLAAYNGGSGNVRKWLNDSRYSRDGLNLHYIPFKETREYVERVLGTYRKYRQLYEF